MAGLAIFELSWPDVPITAVPLAKVGVTVVVNPLVTIAAPLAKDAEGVAATSTVVLVEAVAPKLFVTVR